MRIAQIGTYAADAVVEHAAANKAAQTAQCLINLGTALDHVAGHVDVDTAVARHIDGKLVIGVLPPVAQRITVFPKELLGLDERNLSVRSRFVYPKATVHRHMYPTARVLEILGLLGNRVHPGRHHVHLAIGCSGGNGQFRQIDLGHIGMLPGLGRVEVNLRKHQPGETLFGRHPRYFRHQVGTTQDALHQYRRRVGSHRVGGRVVARSARFVISAARCNTQCHNHAPEPIPAVFTKPFHLVLPVYN